MKELCNGKIDYAGICERCYQVSQTTSGYCTRLIEVPESDASPSPGKTETVKLPWSTKAMDYAEQFARSGVRDERFKMPTDKELIDIMLLFNKGKIQKNKLADMLSPCLFILDRLYENGDIMKPSSKE